MLYVILIRVERGKRVYAKHDSLEPRTVGHRSIFDEDDVIEVLDEAIAKYGQNFVSLHSLNLVPFEVQRTITLSEKE